MLVILLHDHEDRPKLVVSSIFLELLSLVEGLLVCKGKGTSTFRAVATFKASRFSRTRIRYRLHLNAVFLLLFQSIVLDLHRIKTRESYDLIVDNKHL